MGTTHKHPVRFTEFVLGIELLDFQKYVFMESWSKPFVLWVMSRNAGKALALDTPIPTPTGNTTMGDLKVGDTVLDEKGKPTSITHVSEIFLGNNCYRIRFDDGESIIADDDHLWFISSKEKPSGKVSTTGDMYRQHTKLSDTGQIKIPLANFKKTKGKTHKKIEKIEKVPSVATKCIAVDNPTNLFLCGKNFTVTHNSTLIAPFIMAKSMLFSNHQTYILAGTGGQAQGTFLKIEDIALKRISSFTGLTDVFANETVKNGSASNTTGFTHSPRSFEVGLYNGSKINSLNSMPDNVRGFRSNLNFYDESGFTEEELFKASEPFLTQDSNFRLGGDIDSSLLPKQFPNQRIYASSASSTDTYFFKQYREYSKRMMLGDPRYFVADINADMVISATYNGKIFTPPLLSQSVVDEQMRENKEKGMREYGNIFTTEGGDQQIIKRRMIIRNEELRKPVLSSNGGNRKFLISIDPARSLDNSIMTVAELINDKKVGYKLDIVNIINLIDVLKKKKTPMKTPDQIKEFKQALLDYNGIKSADYENIEMVLLDDGSGGGGISAWADNLLEDWVDNGGRRHKGLIDPEHNEYKDFVHMYPNASEKLKLITPQRYKNAMFAALQEMMSLDLITFTESYDGKGELIFREQSGKDIGETKVHKLSDDEIMALVNIDKAKEELVSIYEYKSGTSVRYDLAPDKKNKMHDDRAYTIAMLAWYLQELRRSNVKKEPELSLDNLFMSSGF